MTATAVLARATAWTPPCRDDPDAWFRADNEHRPNWWHPAAITCHGCPIRRSCIEDWLATPAPNVDGKVVGGWVWAAGEVRHHRDDRDLYRRHYPPKETP